MRKLKKAATAVLDRLQRMVGGQQAVPPADRLIDEFFRCGSQYYVSGRYAVHAALMPVGGNLHHHAIEMLLKGVLARSMTSQKLKDYLGHRLRRAWKEFKKQANDPSLSKFDRVIRELDKFESIRYPDEVLKKGAVMAFDVTKVGTSQRNLSAGSLPQYTLCLEEIDELVATIFRVGGRNPKAFLRFMKPEANQFLTQDNLYV